MNGVLALESEPVDPRL
ncbi:MAG: hypothetical protein KDD67_10240 [Ignavibacteriae bacterium]|nr:hypothetical protein [Ignavibacteriota bacterium]MCB9214807.1 hypothetical protein [Ignavibacteria bacterium]